MIVAGPHLRQPASLLPSGDEHPRRAGRVVVATSGSPASQRAIEVAAAIAAEHSGELVILHVQPPRQVRVARLGPTVVGCCWSQDPYSERVLIDARRLACANGSPARVGLIAASPADGIVMAARQLDARQVVIGARTTRLPARLAAPTRARLADGCPVPLLTVPADGRASATADKSRTL